ncbi:type VII secretion integral membrane protein EccD [Streptomyces sp. NPDC003077]|uniref:type VII secretion integral membrane protein EccD n=1 Tax=Streptomyces sp. NPDC003077 TaxID=3154443 RepID=UPI0033B6B717
MVRTEAGRRMALSRVTLVGRRRRVDMVLPAHEPVGALLPEILRLLGDEVEKKPSLRRLVTSDGTVLAQDETLASANVVDGAVLRLVREQETPAAPVVHDVTDEVADDLDVRGWRWGERSRSWSAVAGGVLLAVVAGVCAGWWYGHDRAAVWCGVAALIAAAAGAVVGFLWRGKRLGTALLLVGGALGVLGSWDATGDGRARLAAVGLTVAVVLALLGFLTELGRGGLIGAGAVVVAVGVWELGLALTSPARTGVAVGVVSVLVLGYLPRLAMMSAGLTRLDDRRSGGTPVSRHKVATALGATHRGLALATVTAAASAGAAGVLALSGAEGPGGAAGGWPVGVAVLLCVVLFSRARAYPLAVEVLALLAAGTAVAVRLVLSWESGAGNRAGALGVLCLLAALPLVALAVRPPEHVRVRLSRLMNLVESVGVVVLIPVALGAFGVYGRLLHTF